MGDFNARVGLGDDRDMKELGDGPWSQTSRDPTKNVPPRRSTDTVPPNRLGEALLQLCVSSGLVIIKGTTTGDMHGATTFFADDILVPYISKAFDFLVSNELSLPRA